MSTHTNFKRSPRYTGLAAEKIPRRSAGYVDCGDENRICAICRMFREPNGCSTVSGFISRTGSCRFFDKATSAA
jgi:hypothetical protein